MAGVLEDSEKDVLRQLVPLLDLDSPVALTSPLGIDLAAMDMLASTISYTLGEYGLTKQRLLSAQMYIQAAQRAHSEPGAYCHLGLFVKGNPQQVEAAITRATRIYNSLVDFYNANDKMKQQVGELEKLLTSN